MVGRELTERYPQRNPSPGDVVLEVKNATRKGLFENVSFQVRSGEIVGFSGLMGSGRTEIMRALFGLDHLDSGEIWIKGKKPISASLTMRSNAASVLLPRTGRMKGCCSIFRSGKIWCCQACPALRPKALLTGNGKKTSLTCWSNGCRSKRSLRKPRQATCRAVTSKGRHRQMGWHRSESADPG